MREKALLKRALASMVMHQAARSTENLRNHRSFSIPFQGIRDGHERNRRSKD